MRDLGEFAAMRAALDVPILANMTEFGKSDLFSTDQLRDVGVNMVIWPVSLLRLAMGAASGGSTRWHPRVIFATTSVRCSTAPIFTT